MLVDAVKRKMVIDEQMEIPDDLTPTSIIHKVKTPHRLACVILTLFRHLRWEFWAQSQLSYDY